MSEGIGFHSVPGTSEGVGTHSVVENEPSNQVSSLVMLGASGAAVADIVSFTPSDATNVGDASDVVGATDIVGVVDVVSLIASGAIDVVELSGAGCPPHWAFPSVSRPHTSPTPVQSSAHQHECSRIIMSLDSRQQWLNPLHTTRPGEEHPTTSSVRIHQPL